MRLLFGMFWLPITLYLKKRSRLGLMPSLVTIMKVNIYIYTDIERVRLAPREKE